MAERQNIKKEMTIAEALKKKPAIAGLLMSKGMHCLGCSIAQGETIGEAAEVHGIDPDELINELNSLEAKEEK